VSGRIEVFVAETIRMAVPYVACGLASVVTERAGVVNIGLEGCLALSGLGAAAAAIGTGSVAAGLVAGLVVGVAYCLLHGALVLRARVDAIVSGVALNLGAFGLARVVLRVLYDSASNSPKLPPSTLGVGSALGRVLLEPVLPLLLGALVLVSLGLDRTRLGLRLRAVGDDPRSAEAAGVEVERVQLVASGLAGLICGLGGAHLVLDQRGYDAGMSGGRGFLALAAAIVGRHRPWPTALACLGFAALEATQIALQDSTRWPPELVQLLPFVATLGLLATSRRRAR
jgi:simple sugar transport system permease protein